jgi:hypothetical protein
MTDGTTYAAPTPAPDAFGAAPSEQRVEVEFVTDSYRVFGELRHSGPPRRLVDSLNSIDTGYITVYAGLVDNGNPGGARHFEVAQVKRDAIIIAIPRALATSAGSASEAVRKAPVPATIVLPGYEVSGNIYLLPEANAAMTPILSSRHFVPLTDAVITPSDTGMMTEEPLVVVNLARALFYAPNTRPGSA